MGNRNVKRAIPAILFVFIVINASGQSLLKTYINYIEQYRELAILHQQEFGIPASITLAQGLLESGAGNSELAKVANNHFGIKCHKNWEGRGFYQDDDEANECFRCYDSPESSFEDHARFLKKTRYNSLFELEVTDYKEWARGLKRCGYATDPRYPDKLISIIERYELFLLDSGQVVVAQRRELKADELMEHSIDQEIIAEVAMMHKIRNKWNLHYVIARDGDSFESLSEEFGLSKKKIAGYNDYESADANILPGAIIYLEEKLKKAVADNDTHIVAEDDNLHQISQKYGLKLKSLLKLNDLEADSSLEVGQELKIK